MRQGDMIFKSAMLLPLVLLSGYFLLLVGSQWSFFGIAGFAEQLSRTDISAAVLLSLTAATASNAIAIVLAMPATYALADLPRAVTLVLILIGFSLLVLFAVRLVLEHRS